MAHHVTMHSEKLGPKEANEKIFNIDKHSSTSLTGNIIAASKWCFKVHFK